ncbi:hypothetical protein WA577_002684, partial [Blastocystis sp. JDR]
MSSIKPFLFLLVVLACGLSQDMPIPTMVPKNTRPIPKTIAEQKKEIMLLKEILKAKEDLRLEHTMEENRLKKSLDDKIEGLQEELKKCETQLTSLKTEYSSYVNKNNLLKTERKDWEKRVKSLDSSLHISAFTKKKLNSAKPVLDHLSDYVSTWFNDLKKELQSAFHAIQRDPDFRYLFTSVASFFIPIHAFFAKHVYPILSTILFPVLKPLKVATSLAYQKILAFAQIVAENVIVFVNELWYITRESKLTRNYAKLWYSVLVGISLYCVFVLFSIIIQAIYFMLPKRVLVKEKMD